jgi:hypothetical protein
MKKEIYILESRLADPRFSQLCFVKNYRSVTGRKSLYDDFDLEPIGELNAKPQRLAKDWKAPKVVGVKPFNDCPWLELLIPAFSGRAARVLAEFLEPNGELLPLDSDVGEFYAYNVLTMSDALDLKKSVFEWHEDEFAFKKQAAVVERFEFIASKLKGLTIFRERYRDVEVLVSTEFKERVELAGLNGFRFVKVWPLPEGESWHENDVAERKKMRKSVEKLSGEAFIIRLRHEGTKASPEEGRRFKKICNELDKLMDSQKSLDSTYYGNIETPEVVKSDSRVFFTCPDAEKLHAYLKPYLEQIDWPNEVDIVLRAGNLYDRKAKERRIKIK